MQTRARARAAGTTFAGRLRGGTRFKAVRVKQTVRLAKYIEKNVSARMLVSPSGLKDVVCIKTAEKLLKFLNQAGVLQLWALSVGQETKDNDIDQIISGPLAPAPSG